MADENRAVQSFIEKFAPYVIGSAGGLLWIEGSIWRKCVIFGVGVAFAYYGADLLNHKTGIPLQLGGLLIGLFSMSIADKFVTEWQEFKMGALIIEAARHWLKLPPRGDK